MIEYQINKLYIGFNYGYFAFDSIDQLNDIKYNLPIAFQGNKEYGTALQIPHESQRLYLTSHTFKYSGKNYDLNSKFETNNTAGIKFDFVDNTVTFIVESKEIFNVRIKRKILIPALNLYGENSEITIKSWSFH